MRVLVILLQLFPIYPIENKCPIDHPNKVKIDGISTLCNATACIKLSCDGLICRYITCPNQCEPYSYDLCLSDEELKNAKE